MKNAPVGTPRVFGVFGGKTTVTWQFVDVEDVPGGPWKEIVTTSGISW